jgi:hypothetical protein
MKIFKQFRSKLAANSLQAVGLLLEQKKITWEQLPWQIQFLPTVIKYLPVVGTINTINPDISGISGLVGASKAHLNTKVHPDFRPKDIVFEVGTTVAAMQKIVAERKILFPAFIKPLQGERAAGVQFLPNQAALANAVLEPARAYLIEEAIMTQSEFCISVVRDLATQIFWVFSITERVIPTVIGDGKTSIQKLIPLLDIPDLQKQKILEALEPEFLAKVLAHNVVQTVVRTASISYGTNYVKQRLTLAQKKLLEQQLNKVLSDATGFNIGRFDIKANNLDELLAGKFKVIELNGIGGMPTHVYETHLTIDQKQAILNEYFDLLQNFSRQQVGLGLRPSGFWSALRQITASACNQDRPDSLKRLERQYLWAVMKNMVNVF